MPQESWTCGRLGPKSIFSAISQKQKQGRGPDTQTTQFSCFPCSLGQFFLSCSSLHSVSFFSGFSLLSVPCLHCLQGALPPCLLLGDGGLIQESFAILVNVLRHAKAKHCWNQVLQQNLQVINQYLILFGSSPCTISNKSIAGTILMNLKKELVQNLSTESAWKNLPGLAVIKVQVVHFCGTFAKDLQKQFFHC